MDKKYIFRHRRSQILRDVLEPGG